MTALTLIPLALDSYAPVLDLVGERDEVDLQTILWIVAVFALLVLLPIAANAIRKRYRLRAAIARSHEQLIQLSGRKGLNHLEQRLLERMASAARMSNATAVVETVDGFDRAVAKYVSRLSDRPWEQMLDEIDEIKSVRQKLGFRFIPEDRRPINTRHLAEGQSLYVLARGDGGYRLISAQVLDLDDLAIYVTPFSDGERVVRFQARSAVWAFFWTTLGSECRFKTEVMREVSHGSPYLILAHSDDLVYNPDRKIFSTDLTAAMTIDRLPASTYGRATPSAESFDTHEVETVPVQLQELSGSGCVVQSEIRFAEKDLLRLHGGAEAPDVLEGCVVRVVLAEDDVYRCRFLRKSREDLEAILKFITPRISPAAVKGRRRRRTVKKT